MKTKSENDTGATIEMETTEDGEGKGTVRISAREIIIEDGKITLTMDKGFELADYKILEFHIGNKVHRFKAF